MRAIKVIEKAKASEAEIEEIIREVDILIQLDHPNIIKIFEYFVTKDNIYIVTDVCSGGELFDRIIENGFFNENVAAYIMQQILKAIYYCHSKKIVHRDLKPENVLFTNKNVDSNLKIIDFGTSQVYDPKRSMK